jgi:uncharacterized protein (TIGR02145 family)
VPTQEDWALLLEYLGGRYVAGSKMKEVGTTYWHSPNLDATNISGFTAFPGGRPMKDGDFYDISYWCRFWSSTKVEAKWAFDKCLKYYDSEVGGEGWAKTYGHSERCVKD